MIDALCELYGGNEEMTRAIYEEHLTNELFQRFQSTDELLSEKNVSQTIREINRCYDELVLTNCIIDERIFLENEIQLSDQINSLNENRNKKSVGNRTPLTANQHLSSLIDTSPSDQGLTPISQARLLLEQLHAIIGQQQTGQPSHNLEQIIGQQAFLGKRQSVGVPPPPPLTSLSLARRPSATTRAMATDLLQRIRTHANQSNVAALVLLSVVRRDPFEFFATTISTGLETLLSSSGEDLSH